MMKFGSAVCVLTLSSVTGQSKPKPKPPPTPTPPSLANSTVIYTPGSKTPDGTLGTLSFDFVGDVVNEHLLVSMKSRHSVVALPDMESARIFAFSQDAGDWVPSRDVSYANDPLVQSVGESLCYSDSLAMLGIVSTSQVFLNNSCAELYECSSFVEQIHSEDNRTFIPWCCEDFQMETDVGVHLYDMTGVSGDPYVGLLSWRPILTMMLHSNSSVSELWTSVSLDTSADGLIAAGVSWKTHEYSQWTNGLLILKRSNSQETGEIAFETQLIVLPDDQKETVSSEPYSLLVAVDAEGETVAVGMPDVTTPYSGNGSDDSLSSFLGAVAIFHFKIAQNDQLSNQADVITDQTIRRRIVHPAKSPINPAAGASTTALSEGEWMHFQTLYSPYAEDEDKASVAASMFFGKAVAVYASVLAVGAYDSQSGGESCVFVYTREEDQQESAQTQSSQLWVLHTVLQPSDHFSGNLFGFSLSVSHKIILVGSPRALSSTDIATGAAYLFEQITNISTGEVRWAEMAKFMDGVNVSGKCFGSSVQSTSEGLLMFAAVPAKVKQEIGSSNDDYFSNESYAAQLFTFVPASLQKSDTSDKPSGSSSSSTPQSFLFPLIVTMAAVLALIPVVMLGVHLHRVYAPRRGEAVEDGPTEPNGAPILRVSPLQLTTTGVPSRDKMSNIDVESGGRAHSNCEGESPAGTPQIVGNRRKGTRSGVYTEIGVSEHNGSSIWSSLKSVFVSPPLAPVQASVNSPLQQLSPSQEHLNAKKNPMMVRRDTAIVNA